MTGRVYFVSHLFKDYEVSAGVVVVDHSVYLHHHHHLYLQVRNIPVQVLFCLVFCLSCTMFELIIFEILGLLTPE